MYSLLTTPFLTHDLLIKLLKCFQRHIVLPTVKEKRYHQELSNVQSHLTFHNFTEMCMSFRGFQISNVRHSSEMDVSSQNLPFINFTQVTASDNLFTARSQPQLILSIGGVHFRLIFVQIRNTNFFCNKFCDIWSRISFESFSSSPVGFIESQFEQMNNDWRTLLYERIETDIVQSANRDLIKSINGQNLISCSDHNTILCLDSPGNDFICQFDVACKNKSAWRCHFPECQTAVCRKQFRSIVIPTSLSTIPGKRLPTSRYTTADISSNITAQTTITTFPSVDICPFDEQNPYFEGLTAAGIEINEYNDNTDSGAKPVWSSKGKSSSAIGSCVLRNGVGNILHRSRRPITFANGQWRHIQKYVASVPQTSNVLRYPEAMVRPSVFSKFMGNALIGAFPSILLGDNKFNSSFNFAGIIDHIQTRLVNGSLLISVDPHMLLLYFDTYLNHQLNHQDVRFVISRGLPELANVGDFSYDRVRMKLEEEDGRRLVYELSAAFPTKNSSILLTFTLNQSAIFGVKPLFDIIQEHTKHMPADERRNVKEGAMSLYLQMWERSSHFL